VDWPRARAILLAAFAVVNLMLAYTIWGPNASIPGPLAASQQQSIMQLRQTLSGQGLVLPSHLTIPRTPEPMRFLRVELPATPVLERGPGELSHGPQNIQPEVDPETQALVYRPAARGLAAREVRLDNTDQVWKAAEEYLRAMGLFPSNAHFSGVFHRPDRETVVVEYVPQYDGLPVYSGYVRVELSAKGIETVTTFWVLPRHYTQAPPKEVRPAGEALLRLAGRLTGAKPRTVTSIQLGYYGGRPFTMSQTDAIHGWDTVPVWRITLDSGETYYINAFNGELEF
jgi:hypothetical protein